MEARIKYDFSGKIWKHNANGGWYFVSLPVDISNEIRNNLKWQEEGWGRMRISASIIGIKWDTAIWFDKKLGTYLLPLKADIRKKSSLNLNDIINVSIYV